MGEKECLCVYVQAYTHLEGTVGAEEPYPELLPS